MIEIEKIANEIFESSKKERRDCIMQGFLKFIDEILTTQKKENPSLIEGLALKMVESAEKYADLIVDLEHAFTFEVAKTMLENMREK